MNPQSHHPDPVSVDQLVDDLMRSYLADQRTGHMDSTFLPSRAKAIEIVELLRRVMFPGFFDDHRIEPHHMRFHLGDRLMELRAKLGQQIRQALRYEQHRTASAGQQLTPEQEASARAQAESLTAAFLQRLVEIRRVLGTDVQAAFDGDPAANSTDEAVFCYPGIDAVFIYRIAHELHRLGVPLLPRIMSEYAHNETGIDIHPGAQIGESFFIDHGTGVVIGETACIGSRVRMYQNVTLGALSTRGGQAWKGRKRHPTVEDDVTIYGGAVILGGETVIGAGCTIGGAVFLTQSVPPGHIVTMQHQGPLVTPSPRSMRMLKKKEAGSTPA